MAFEYCDSMRHHYYKEGYIIFRDILPPSVIKDLRHAARDVPRIAREIHKDPQAQRLQPVCNYDIDLKSFEDYSQLPVLVEAIGKILTPEHLLGRTGLGRMGLFVEPLNKPYCTDWHRDITEGSNPPDDEEFERIRYDPLWFNQINCPLYEDNCTWLVPGSHLRSNIEGEKEASGSPRPDKDASYEELERGNLAYCRGMPNAVRACMDAGDLVLYQPLGWHIGNYLPDQQRLTIHDYAPTEFLLDWYERWQGGASPGKKKKEEKKKAKAKPKKKSKAKAVKKKS